jgi:hypothetical protein
MVEGFVNDELERMLKEAFVSYSKLLSWHFSGGTGEKYEYISKAYEDSSVSDIKIFRSVAVSLLSFFLRQQNRKNLYFFHLPVLHADMYVFNEPSSGFMQV